MKFLRGLYMIIAWITFLPISVVILVGWFAYVLGITNDFKETARAWWNCLRTGIKMNSDFVKYGFK